MAKKQADKTALLKTAQYFSVRPYKFLLMVVAVLSLGCLIGVFYQGFGSPQTDKRYPLASVKQKKEARAQIIDTFMAQNSTECSDPSDPIPPSKREEVFKNYLKVNKYANRAVIRGCNDIDQLLAKNSKGEWYATTVNIALDTRANPFWQAECLIDDITTADTVVRPENSSIDTSNYVECQRLNEQYFVKMVLTQGLKELNQTPSDTDVMEYIRSVREQF